MFTPVIQESLADQVENKIHEYMKANRLRPGDSFPKEEELATMLQISRPVVREALSRLRMMGLVTSRKRRGMVVAKPTIFATMAKVINPDFLDADEQADFMRLRVTIELGLADFLLLNITSDEIDELEKVVRREESDPADFELYMQCDYLFHSLIYQATGCSSLASFQGLLYRFFSDIKSRKAFATKGFSQRFTDPQKTTHRDILEAIKSGDPEVVHQTMRKHLSLYLQKKEMTGK